MQPALGDDPHSWPAVREVASRLSVGMGALDMVSLGVAIVLAVAVQALMLLARPTVNDLIYRWSFGLEWIGLEELRRRSSELAAGSC